jgi:hypothetical protein
MQQMRYLTQVEEMAWTSERGLIVCAIRLLVDWIQKNYRDDLSRMPTYVTITTPTMPGCSWQWYWKVPCDVKV